MIELEKINLENAINLKDVKDKCFAKTDKGVCEALWEDSPCTFECPFYKPTGCEDWIRLEKGAEKWLIPPEELGLE